MLELSSDMLIIVRVFLAYLSRCEFVETPHEGKCSREAREQLFTTTGAQCSLGYHVRLFSKQKTLEDK